MTLMARWLLDLHTMRTWKSDTTTAIYSHAGFASRYQNNEYRQTANLYHCLQNVVSKDYRNDAISSISKRLVAPAIALAQKVGICCHI
jgi:hypothetical protein